MSSFLAAISYIFLLVALGYGTARVGLLKADTETGLSDFVFTIAMPLLLFRTLSTAAFGDISPWGLWATYFAAVAVTWTAAHLAIRHLFGRDARAGVVAGITGAFSNLVLLGVPFMLGVYGEAGLAVLSLIVSVHLPVMIGASIILFEWAVRADGVEKRPVGPAQLLFGFVRQLLTNPLIIGILAGVAARLAGLALPGLADKVVDALADVAGPVALFAMGMSLVRFDVAGNVRGALSLISLKLLLMPAVALFVALLLGLQPMTAKVAIAAASLPSGVNAWLIASQFDTGQRLASTAITLGTASALVSTALWLAIAQYVFG